MEKKEEKWSKPRVSERMIDRLDRIVRWSTEIKSGINELCEMANMPGVGLEIFKAGGGWRDQKRAPSWSVKLPSLRQGRVQTLPCSLGRQSARSPSLERGKPRLSALKRRHITPTPIKRSTLTDLFTHWEFALPPSLSDLLLANQCSAEFLPCR
ncbi:hypothetical protein T09_12442 [Trichinella sp. T9]|nr:hypothetical protein T09_12442 [Trichinella sp. T9]